MMRMFNGGRVLLHDGFVEEPVMKNHLLVDVIDTGFLESLLSVSKRRYLVYIQKASW